jgi:hypothetical protein
MKRRNRPNTKTTTRHDKQQGDPPKCGFIVNGIRRMPGDCWRSNTVTQCPICTSKTNKITLASLPDIGPRFVCPCEGLPAHNLLDALLQGKEDAEVILRLLETINIQTCAEKRVLEKAEWEYSDSIERIKAHRLLLRVDDIIMPPETPSVKVPQKKRSDSRKNNRIGGNHHGRRKR